MPRLYRADIKIHPALSGWYGTENTSLGRGVFCCGKKVAYYLTVCNNAKLVILTKGIAETIYQHKSRKEKAMSIVRDCRKIYSIVSGVHKGRSCVIVGAGKRGPNSLSVIFAESRGDERVSVDKGQLAVLEVPGWEFHPENRAFPYDLEGWFRQQGDGSCMLRDSRLRVVQPNALRKNDILATGSVVTCEGREGGNGSVLVCLDNYGWVDLAARLPLALSGNERFKLPIELAKGDKLITGCEIGKGSHSAVLNWVNVYLKKESDCIDVPSCIPLALA